MTPWENFLIAHSNKIEINGFTAADSAKILSVLEAAYNGSPIFKNMLVAWVGNLIKPSISINFYGGSSGGALANAGYVRLDIPACEALIAINNKGEAIAETLDTVLIHELVHATTGRLDNGVGTRDYDPTRPLDYKGENMIFSNIVYSELGIIEENSYLGQSNIGGGILTTGIQYTNGAEIDRSVVFSPNCTNWDTSLI